MAKKPSRPPSVAEFDPARGMTTSSTGANAAGESNSPIAKSFYVGQDLNWTAPWVEVVLRIELPFWLMVNSTHVRVEVEGHEFPVALENEYFELNVGFFSDAKDFVAYQGPWRQNEQLPMAIQALLRGQPGVGHLWRKCKTLLKITSRCNEDVWRKRVEAQAVFMPSVDLYLQELCRAHVPIVNKLIQAYRLSTYDFFPFEVAPWDVPRWHIERNGITIPCLLVPYRGWDHRIKQMPLPDRPGEAYQLIEATQLQDAISNLPTAGEFELLDAINLMERGNYSDAVRRITTALEVVIEAAVGDVIKKHDGEEAATRFLKKTRTNFPLRVKTYEELSGRTLPEAHRRELGTTRNLRHRIVHGGYRISPGERGGAQRSVDTGRWIFNWFENDETRKRVREKRVGLRSIGRDIMAGVFRSSITKEGVVLVSIMDDRKVAGAHTA